jgi:hypothetical protein
MLRDVGLNPSPEETGAPGTETEIEVTPEMIEAGVLEICDFNYLDDDPREYVILVYRAMRQLAPRFGVVLKPKD